MEERRVNAHDVRWRNHAYCEEVNELQETQNKRIMSRRIVAEEFNITEDSEDVLYQAPEKRSLIQNEDRSAKINALQAVEKSPLAALLQKSLSPHV
ncbi:hypothetical protein [Desulfonatronum thiosulfatophilum]|uniref:hypothetical protein n=1 Tax=Desulfonatronum thiosulfatophilum TaxID=617002 RepID=UPI0011135CD1|nr:hypothetical protein [Desulfonatronum thiosulfatophilum]